jgi:hypothetical protein
MRAHRRADGQRRAVPGVGQHVDDLAGLFALARIGDRDDAAIGQHQLAAVAGLPATMRIEHRAIELHAAFVHQRDDRVALGERGVLAKQFLGHRRPRVQSITVPSTHGATSPPIHVPWSSRCTWMRPARPIAPPCAAT